MTYQYDIGSRKEVITDANLNPTAYYYDDYGNIVKTVAPNGGITEQISDENNKRLSMTDTLGNQTEYTYNELNQLIQEDGITGAVEYRYDNARNLTFVIS